MSDQQKSDQADSPDISSTPEGQPPNSQTQIKASVELEAAGSSEASSESSESGVRSVTRTTIRRGIFGTTREEIQEKGQFDRKNKVAKKKAWRLTSTILIVCILGGLIAWLILSGINSNIDNEIAPEEVSIVSSTLDEELGVVDPDLTMPGIEILEKKVFIDFSNRVVQGYRIKSTD